MSSGRQQGNSSTRRSQAPNGACRDFWQNEQCRYGPACKFRHERSGQSASSIRSAVGTSAGANLRGARGFSGTYTSQEQTSIYIQTTLMDAGQAAVYLEHLCLPHATLKTVAQVRILLNIIKGLASDSSNWSSEDRQLTLGRLCSEGGLLRIHEILMWGEVTTSPNPPPKALSFQSEFMNALSLFTCKAVIVSTMRTQTNTLYALINREYLGIQTEVIASMDALVSTGSFSNEESSVSKEMPFGRILEVLAALLKGYLERFSSAPTTNPTIKDFPTHLGRWLNAWSSSNSGHDRESWQITKLRQEIARLSLILNRDSSPKAHAELGSQVVTLQEQQSALQPSEAQLSIIHRVYQAPGGRHDNDHASIADIVIAPTLQELSSTLSSFIPSTLHDAPHHLPMQSMDRLLDIQFRLLREEFVYPIKAATGLVLNDLKMSQRNTVLHPILAERGGRYKGQMDSDAVFFSVYTNVELGEISADRRGVSVALSFDTPPGKGRSKKVAEREAHWKAVGRKRLNAGGFVALVWNKTEIHLGLITSQTEDLITSSKASENHLSIRVSFFGSEIERRVLAQGVNKSGKRKRGFLSPHLLLEIQILYEASRPFLEALKAEPTDIPFSKYLKQEEEGALSNSTIDPPEYAIRPAFEWDLSSLFNPPLSGLKMRAGNQTSTLIAQHNLRTRAGTRLDPSQADAIVSCLTREVALIQGPPGTGKSYTAVQLLRVLISNNITNILMIAFTNHALDHLLESILDAGITRKIVRLGTRSQSERLQGFTLDKLEKFHDGFLRRGVNTAFASMKRAEEAFNDGMLRMKSLDDGSSDLDPLLQLNYPEHQESLNFPPDNIQTLAEEHFGLEANDFTKKYQLWEEGKDLGPATGWRRSRGIPALLQTFNVWSMSADERKLLSRKWKAEAMESHSEIRLASFKNLKKNYCESREVLEEVNLMKRLEALKNADIIGCTTTGAAKLLNLLKGLQPKVILVEEAGQVLEAHSIAILVPSVEHLIMIGDPLQLRPSINTYAFASENPRGGQLYRFDRSLMERLSASGLPMSQLTIQRRMRPAVSNLIRRCLYPHLQDHESVKGYPSVRGMAKDVWFLHHTHKEGGGGDDGVSKCNMFEVEMVKSLVLFFLRQGIYNNPNSIVVLCTYLGQLTKIRDALASCKLSVVLDERDENVLLDRDDKDDSVNEAEPTEIDVSKQIRIRTVDNFQGEEADIIILSLVRNPGEGTGGIGFLKSSNRTNVALSRARHGMFVLGHGEALERGGGIWSTIIDEFRAQEAYGPAFPFACYRHPRDVQWLSEPKIIDSLFSDGRCLLPCGTKLKCGHACPSKCHPDDQFHASIRCMEPCGKLCPLGHPCSRMCYEDCKCDFIVPELRLPCGHKEKGVACATACRPRAIICRTTVRRTFPTCEHAIELPCHKDISQELCSAPCGKEMDCCSRKCKASCYTCQRLQSRRTLHARHPCEKTLHCQHLCNDPCVAGHQCVCTQPCRQVCDHSRCTAGCAKSCTPCAEPCTWACDHQACHVSCGSPCTRLPCDLRCKKTLGCGHPCPSLCGEPCSCQLCPQCATPNQKAQVVDMILSTTLEEIDLASPELDSILITLACQHTFTVETLDGVCGLRDYYQQEDNRWIKPTLPPPGSALSPVCPQCRGEIASRRYGRVLKRCNLDLLERSVATETAVELRDIADLHDILHASNLESSLLAVQRHDPSSQVDAARLLVIQGAYHDRTSNDSKSSRPFKPAEFFGRCLYEDLGMLRQDAEAWSTNLKGIYDLYKRAYQVSCKRSAHRIAYEHGLNRLYRQELERTSSSLRSAQQARQDALDSAKIAIGITRPLADLRFRVEAIWITIELRLAMASIAAGLRQKVAKEERDNTPMLTRMFGWVSSITANKRQGEVMGLFVQFIYDSCEIDAKLALRTAETSGAHRQILKSELKLLRISLASFNTKVRLLDGESATIIVEKRQELATIGNEMHREASAAVNRAMDTYFSHKGRATEEIAWVKASFLDTAHEILNQWAGAIAALRRGTFYQPLTIEERKQVQQAFNFTHRGHWFICPNGHTFVIGECGGAMAVGRCIECGAPVGGGRHQLLSTNARDAEFENIAREQGVAQSPWRWAADA